MNYKDNYWDIQQDFLVEFAELLVKDFTLADTAYQSMKHDPHVDPRTLSKVAELYKEHVAEHTEQCREDMITRNLAHV